LFRVVHHWENTSRGRAVAGNASLQGTVSVPVGGVVVAPKSCQFRIGPARTSRRRPRWQPGDPWVAAPRQTVSVRWGEREAGEAGSIRRHGKPAWSEGQVGRIARPRHAGDSGLRPVPLGREISSRDARPEAAPLAACRIDSPFFVAPPPNERRLFPALRGSNPPTTVDLCPPWPRRVILHPP
jgi:hypothetical protein